MDIRTTENNVVKELITRRRRQILVHSCIYYKFNTSLISDQQYDTWAKELMQLQRDYPQIAAKCPEAEAFADYNETTSGFNLPLHGWAQAVAEQLLRYHNEMEA